MIASPHIVIVGAGAIGCFVGGLMAVGGQRVTLLARPRITQELAVHGLHLTDFAGLQVDVNPDQIVCAENPSCLSQADIVLVTVKSKDTWDVADLIAQHAPEAACVVSLQNGVANADVLKKALPGRDIRAGMVPFNVVPKGQGGFHRATSGDIVIGRGPGAVAENLNVPYLAVTERPDIKNVQWGKFLINLNNALNALSGLPLQQQLQDRAWRQVMADQWTEALKVLRAGKITPASTTPVAVGLIPWILRLPTPLFVRVAASMLTIDAQARTSMAHDLMAGRPTEIDALQGEVVRRGQDIGVPTPVNAAVAVLIERASANNAGLPNLSPHDIRENYRR